LATNLRCHVSLQRLYAEILNRKPKPEPEREPETYDILKELNTWVLESGGSDAFRPWFLFYVCIQKRYMTLVLDLIGNGHLKTIDGQTTAKDENSAYIIAIQQSSVRKIQHKFFTRKYP
jgi:hypothetical protein